ncbi:MAG: hypothetical protein EOO01_43550 [Chitinophagaceae bacterium]|nr:MAG: hypothetical protein EOO01_43550 [Chitinophagaceae bacterium]
MEANQEFDPIPVSQDFIARLGYHETSHPRQYRGIRNGEPLELTVHFFENGRSQKVIYYTEAVYIPSGKIRHKTLFQFDRNNDPELLHNFCLHTLFFDEKIEARFEEENRFHPPAQLNTSKAEAWLNWIRVYWNTNHFNSTYKELGGLSDNKQLIFD